MKKTGKKWLGIFLAVSMALTAVFPMEAALAAEAERKMERVEKKESSEENRMMESVEEIQQPEKQREEAEKEVSENIQMEETESVMPLSAGYDINQPVIEKFELVENGQTVTTDETVHFKLWAYDADSGIESVTVYLNGYGYDYREIEVKLHKSGEGNLYTGEYPCTRRGGNSVHVTRIQVEDKAGNYAEEETRKDGCFLYRFEVAYPEPEVNNEKVSGSDFRIEITSSGDDGKLRPGDKVTFSARLTCEGGELTGEGDMFIKMKANTVSHSDYIKMNWDADSGTMTGTYTVTEDTYPAEWFWENMTVWTKSGISYWFYPNRNEPDANLKFTVVQETYDTQRPVIKSINIDKNGQMVKAGDKVTITIKVEEENPRDEAEILFRPSGTGIIYYHNSLTLNRKTMEYTGQIDITDETYPCKWELERLELSDRKGHNAMLSDIQEDWETNCPWYYTVDPEGYRPDREDPVIESITIDKKGQWVLPGDTVTLKVKVKEDHPAQTARARFSPQVANVSSNADISLKYNQDTGEYIGTTSITENTYPCEWMLTELSISDTKGNEASLRDFDKFWEINCPWYYRVKTDNTYREDFKDVTVTVLGFVRQENGSYQYNRLISSRTVEKVGRRASLKELGVSLPQAPEGINVTWTRNSQIGYGPEVDENTELIFAGTDPVDISIYGNYDRDCANVSLTYMTKDQGIKTAMVPVFVEAGSTYREVLEQLKLPEDASETGFSGFLLGEGQDENSQIWGVGWMSAEAEYNNCQVSWHTRYQGSNGMGAEKGVVKSYEKGMTVKDALAELEPPETVEGMEFEGWVLTKGTEDDILSSPMTELEVTAVYRGKTTVDVLYTYRGEDGKLATGNRLMFLNGENLSDAAVQGEATSVFKEVNHLKGLMLSEWEGDMEVNQGRYKSIRFRAKYYNCVVILKFPDESCQYIVVNRGSRYTLPTENEKYTDLLWEGCEKGETVVITEDREFLACAGKRKDGTEEGPQGVKLPEEEISRIVAEIEQSGSGETITIDMKQATVVPKEVLEAIQGKEVQIVLDMGSYSWTIGGTEVAAAELKDIDLEVKADTGAVPTGLINELAEGKPATQLTLTHNGEFGFRADLTLNMGSENSGGTGNLYYYDSAGKLIFRNAGQIGEDGNISLSFSHASDYVVVVDRPEKGKESSKSEENAEKTGQKRDTAEIKKKENPVTTDSGEKEDSDSGKRKSPKTGEA